MPALALALLSSGDALARRCGPAWAYTPTSADHFVIPQSRRTNWIRNASPSLLLATGRRSAPSACQVPPARPCPLMMGPFPLPYDHGRIAKRTSALVARLPVAGRVHVAPTGIRPHVPCPGRGGVRLGAQDRVLRYAVPLLAAYAVGSALLFGAGPLELAPHAMAGLPAWLVVRLWPYRLPERAAEEPAPAGLGLRL